MQANWRDISFRLFTERSHPLPMNWCKLISLDGRVLSHLRWDMWHSHPERSRRVPALYCCGWNACIKRALMDAPHCSCAGTTQVYPEESGELSTGSGGFIKPPEPAGGSKDPPLQLRSIWSAPEEFSEGVLRDLWNIDCVNAVSTQLMRSKYSIRLGPVLTPEPPPTPPKRLKYDRASG